MSENPQAVVAALRKALSNPMAKAQLAAVLSKDANSTFHQSAVATSGITAYDLQAPALSLYPVITPLRNSLARVGNHTGIQANWRAITGINTSGMRPGVSPGNRTGVQAVATKDYTAAFKTIGAEVNTDFEAEYAAQGFDDPRALATLTGLRSLMISEEQTILGGNADQLLGTTPTPNATDAGGGTGVLVNNTAYSIICCALSFDGFQYGTVAGGIQGSITRTNADGSSDTFGGGAAAVSANVVHTTGNSPATATYTITASLTSPVLGAAGYAWFISATVGQERLVAITSAPTVAIGALPSGANQLASSLGANDNSVNSLVFDGMIYLAIAAGSNAYTKAISATLTGDGAGGIVEVDAACKDRWDNFRLGFDTMIVNSQQMLDIGKKILTGTSTAAQRFTFVSDPEKIAGGIMVATYRNKFSMNGAQIINIMLHPNMPPGMILLFAHAIPYPLSGVGNVIQIATRKDYFQIDWPLRSRKWESGVYADEVLQHYFTPSMALLYDVRAG